MRILRRIQDVVPRLYLRIRYMTESLYETVFVTAREVACNGGGGPLGHPKVYLHIDHDNDDTVTCPYCSRMFVLKHSQQPSAA